MRNELTRQAAHPMAAIALGFVVYLAAGCASGEPERPTEGMSARCGDGVIEAGESCVSCSSDCPAPPCPSGTEQMALAVRLSVPFGDLATSVTTRIGYDDKLLTFPASGLTADAQKRIQNRPKGAATYANALGNAVRVVQTKNDGLPNGTIYTVALDRCNGAPGATPSDVTCTVEGCAGKFGLIDGCACSVEPRGLDVSDVGTKQN